MALTVLAVAAESQCDCISEEVEAGPIGTFQIKEWQSLDERPLFGPNGEDAARDWLNGLCSLPVSRPPVPRIFISHRRVDRPIAERTANLVSQCGFRFWLDILDPTLQRLSALPPTLRTAIATAAVIEMALLNCTHVIALRTTNSKGSAWIPYEYGRAKIRSLTSGQAACCNLAVTAPLEEYFHLGEILLDTHAVKQWLGRELPGASPLPEPFPGAGDHLP